MPDTATLELKTPGSRTVACALLRDERAAEERLAPNGERYDHRFVASTERVASDRGIILLSAWRLDEFMRRPRFIAAHDKWGHPALTALGRVVDARIESGLPVESAGPSGRGLVAYVRYAPTRIAQDVRRLYDEGMLSDVSVSWDPRTEEVRAPFSEEVQQHGEELAWVATRADLIELSSVLWGADDGAQVLRSRVREAITKAREIGKPVEALEAVAEAVEKNDVEAVTRAFGEAGDGAAASATGEEGAKPTPAPTRTVDVSAAADAVQELDEALAQMDAAFNAIGVVRQRAMDAVTALRNLVGAAIEAPGGGDGSEPAAGQGTPPGTNEPAGSDQPGELPRADMAALVAQLAAVNDKLERLLPAEPAPVPEPVAEAVPERTAEPVVPTEPEPIEPTVDDKLVLDFSWVGAGK